MKAFKQHYSVVLLIILQDSSYVVSECKILERDHNSNQKYIYFTWSYRSGIKGIILKRNSIYIS